MGALDWPDILQSIFRWFHVFAGILWIGMLYFFNFVNGPLMATLDADTKKKVVPELMPRALFWFRIGALLTWVTGILLLGLVYYHAKIAFNDATWTPYRGILVLVTLLAPFIYDPISKAIKNPLVFAVLGFLLIAGLTVLFECAGFSYRGLNIHVGTAFGTIMAFNVWFRIWPAQQQIIMAVKNGTPPDAALVAMAGLRSRHNTFLSFPLLWTMINAHHPVAGWWLILPVTVFAWIGIKHVYKRAGKIKGF